MVMVLSSVLILSRLGLRLEMLMMEWVGFTSSFSYMESNNYNKC